MKPRTKKKSFSFLFSPLLSREIRVFLRSNKAFLCLLLFLGLLWIVVYLNWTTFIANWRPDRDIASGARNFFYTLTSGHLLLILMLMPVLMAPAIVEEREKMTLDLLVSSPISIFHLVLAKLISPLLYVFLLLTASIPVLSLCFLGGGLGLGDLLHVYLLLLGTSVLYGCLGLFCSTLRPRVYEVYLLSAGITLVLSLLLPFHGSLWKYVTTVRWDNEFVLNHGWQVISPFYILSSLIYRPSPLGRSVVLGEYLLAVGVISTGLLTAAIYVVRRISTGAVSESSEAAKEPVQQPGSTRGRDYEITFDLTSQDGNPGLVLERRVQWFARLPVLLRLFYTALMFSVLTLPFSSYQGSWLFLSLPFVTAAFFTLPLAATSISSDFERETLPLLKTSLLSARQIVDAKFTTSLRYSLLIAMALYLPGMLIQIICSSLGYEVDLVTNVKDTFAILFYPVMLFFSLVLYNAWGIFCSAYFRRSNRALVISGIVILGTLAAPFVLPKIQMFALSTVSYFMTFVFMFLSPLAGISTLFPPGSIKFLERSLFEVKQLSDITYGFPLGQCVLYLIMTYYLLARAAYALENQD